MRNKNCLWWPCLLMDRDKMSNLYRGGPSIDASYQVSVHMAEGFQSRRLKCEKLTDDRQQTTDTKWWQKLTLPLASWAKNILLKHMLMKDILSAYIRKLTYNIYFSSLIQPFSYAYTASNKIKYTCNRVHSQLP